MPASCSVRYSPSGPGAVISRMAPYKRLPSRRIPKTMAASLPHRACMPLEPPPPKPAAWTLRFLYVSSLPIPASFRDIPRAASSCSRTIARRAAALSSPRSAFRKGVLPSALLSAARSAAALLAARFLARCLRRISSFISKRSLPSPLPGL